MQPTVLINQHRQTAIIVAQSGKKHLVVELGKGVLTVASLSAKDLWARGYIISDYPPKQAALSYLRHAAGVSERAKGYLEDVAHGEFSAPLLFG
jgi:hypothetical protein